MAKLEGKVCLIAGGTGTVGEALCRVFLQSGATLVVPSRSSEKLKRLCDYLGPLKNDRLTLLEGHIGEQAGAESIRDELLRRHGTLHAVITALGRSAIRDLPL